MKVDSLRWWLAMGAACTVVTTAVEIAWEVASGHEMPLVADASLSGLLVGGLVAYASSRDEELEEKV